MQSIAEHIAAIHNTATQAAQQAETEFRELPGKPGYCGFAWVHVNERASTKVGRALKTVSFRKSYHGGLDLWNPGRSCMQHMDVKETGALAYAAVLRGFGIDAHMDSRSD